MPRRQRQGRLVRPATEKETALVYRADGAGSGKETESGQQAMAMRQVLPRAPAPELLTPGAGTAAATAPARATWSPI